MFSRFSRLSCNGVSAALFRPYQTQHCMNGLLLKQTRTLYTINVGDLMKRMKQNKLFSIEENQNVRTAAQTMEAQKIGALVVCNQNNNNEMVGIITARDIQQAVAEYEPNQLNTVSVQFSIFCFFLFLCFISLFLSFLAINPETFCVC